VTYLYHEITDLGAGHWPRLRNQAADHVEAPERAVVRMVESVSSKARAGPTRFDTTNASVTELPQKKAQHASTPLSVSRPTKLIGSARDLRGDVNDILLALANITDCDVAMR
jgi:hypothetical protein